MRINRTLCSTASLGLLLASQMVFRSSLLRGRSLSFNGTLT